MGNDKKLTDRVTLLSPHKPDMHAAGKQHTGTNANKHTLPAYVLIGLRRGRKPPVQNIN
jgi:hypothetical protein